METRLYQALQANPIIAAVRDDDGLITEKQERLQALDAGALAISTTSPRRLADVRRLCATIQKEELPTWWRN